MGGGFGWVSGGCCASTGREAAGGGHTMMATVMGSGLGSDQRRWWSVSGHGAVD